MTFKYFIFIISIALIYSCEREHLQPDTPGQPDPLVYFIGRIGNDSIRMAGGVDSYIGSTGVIDTNLRRVFNFKFENFDHPSRSSLQISINNYQQHPVDIQSDLDHSVFPGDRHYQDIHHYIPLAVTVIWLDAQGIEYSSRRTPQSNLFTILQVDEIHHEGHNYKKVTIEFECNLADNAGHILHLTNARAVILLGIN